MLKRINQILPELIAEILIYGLFIQLTGVWFVTDKWSYSVGLWLGIGIAMGMAVHMAVVILDTVDMVIEKRARMKATAFSVLRYMLIAAIFIIVAYTKVGNILTMFIGVMGLKAAAYFWPFTHKFFTKFKERGRGDVSTGNGR